MTGCTPLAVLGRRTNRGRERLNGFGRILSGNTTTKGDHQMIGRRAVGGLALLCALLFSAFASQSAFAETTAFECTKSAATLDFSDAHCDTTAAPPSNFGHAPLSTAVKTKI